MKSEPKPIRVCETIEELPELEEIPEEIEIESESDVEEDIPLITRPALKKLEIHPKNIQQEFHNLIRKSITSDYNKICRIQAMYLAHSYLEVAEHTKTEALKKAYELCKDDISTGRIKLIMRALEPMI